MIYFINSYDKDYAFYYVRKPKLDKARLCESLRELRKSSEPIEEGTDGGQWNFLSQLYGEDYDELYDKLGWQNAMNQMHGYMDKNKKALDFLEYVNNLKVIKANNEELAESEQEIIKQYLDWLIDLNVDKPDVDIQRDVFDLYMSGEHYRIVRKEINDDFDKDLLFYFDKKENL